MLLPAILDPYIYNCDSPINLADTLRNDLIPYASDSIKQEMAGKLTDYTNIVSDSQYKVLVRTLANGLIGAIMRNFPDLQFDCEGRFKSLVSFIEKVLYLQSKGKSLDTLKDIIGLRIITLNASIRELYSLSEVVFNFFVLQNFTPCRLTTTESGRFKKELYPDIEVPKKRYLPKHIVPYAKDYVSDPKSNGYQSIHFVFYDKESNRYIEIQLRTQKMDSHATFGEKGEGETDIKEDSNPKTNETSTEEFKEVSEDANHDKYKETRKQFVPRIDIDIQKISMTGFIAASETEFTDRCGLIRAKSIILLN